MKKELTEFEKISGYLYVLEKQQEVVTDLLTAAGENQGTVADIIMRFESAISLTINELRQQLAELDHIEEQKAHMSQVLEELKAIKSRTADSMDASATQFRELANTVPAEIEQNILATIQETDIAGAVRQRTDAQMETIAEQVDRLSKRSDDFVKKIEKKEENVTLGYNWLERYFFGVIVCSILAIVVTTGVSAKFFFSQEIEKNRNAISATYQKVSQLEEQLKSCKVKK
ncbi:hypothetical protein Xsto_03938 [Xenorhabdus stockiae]|uniref:Uncharacterized protein n=1 Tax=Xenorhabdus stockiae TaxID=351614 RepID=A0A2D0KBC2_9GAMM|nr:hypothetical protein [Xenorhabdus stockiae]PHM60507.1 hypothetical protein Xsto_03938 [Xenorhabdus stockiae]